MDDVLGPVFAATEMNWNTHIETLVDFWSWQLFGERGYDGNPLRAHEPVHARTPFTAEHYDRWLELFEDTVDNLFAGSGRRPGQGSGAQDGHRDAASPQRRVGRRRCADRRGVDELPRRRLTHERRESPVRRQETLAGARRGRRVRR